MNTQYTCASLAEEIAESISCISFGAMLRCAFCMQRFAHVSSNIFTSFKIQIYGTEEVVVIPFNIATERIKGENVSSTIRSIETMLPQKYPSFAYCCEERSKNRLYEIAAIVGSRLLSNGKTEYRVRWSMYPPEQDTWEPEENVSHCTALLNAYYCLD